MTQDDIERFSSLGTYLPAQFFARIRVDSNLDDLGPEGATVLMHEYWHYLQNVSTVAGVREFLRWQNIVGVFSKTLQAHGDGSSVGADALSDDERTAIIRLLERSKATRGDRAPEGRGGSNELLSRVTEVNGRRIQLSLTKRGYDIGAASYELGTAAIEESVAWLVEAETAALFRADMHPPPEFPYRTLERLAEFVLGRKLEGPVLAGIGTLSLLWEDPGKRLVPLLQAFRSLAEQEGDLAGLRKLAACHVAQVEAFRIQVRSELDNLLKMQEGRGLSERAMAHYAATIDSALERRTRDPLFDLAPFLDETDESGRKDRLSALVGELPPCDVEMLLKDENGALAPKLVTFDPRADPVSGLGLSQHLRAFQAQVHHAWAHTRTGTPVDSRTLRSAPCPYLASCSHPLRTEQPSICEASPWLHARASVDLCWYAAGVAASLGTVEIRVSTPK